jgi:hypothetical protein
VLYVGAGGNVTGSSFFSPELAAKRLSDVVMVKLAEDRV